jgi:hypothetical protein
MGQCKSKDKDFKSYPYEVFSTTVVCKSEHQGFKKAKEKTWDSVNLRKKVLKNSEARF